MTTIVGLFLFSSGILGETSITFPELKKSNNIFLREKRFHVCSYHALYCFNHIRPVCVNTQWPGVGLREWSWLRAAAPDWTQINTDLDCGSLSTANTHSSEEQHQSLVQQPTHTHTHRRCAFHSTAVSSFTDCEWGTNKHKRVHD